MRLAHFPPRFSAALAPLLEFATQRLARRRRQIAELAMRAMIEKRRASMMAAAGEPTGEKAAEEDVGGERQPERDHKTLVHCTLSVAAPKD
jgi:hypothetical protein